MPDTEKEALCARIDELCAEVERLRGQGEQLFDKTLELGTENAKLRGLVRYAYECAIHRSHATCDDCRRMNGYCILEHRMRELRVEVDE